MARLEEIVHALEAGKPVARRLPARLRGGDRAPARCCTRRLEEAERRIEILMQNEGGARAEPFRWEEGHVASRRSEDVP